MAAIRPMECPGSSAAVWLALVKQVAVGSRRSAAHSAARRRKAPSTIIAGTASSHNKAPDTRLPPATRRPMVKRAMGIDKTGFPQPFLGWTRVARNAIRPDVAVDSAAHSGDRSPNCQRNRDGSPPPRSADAIDWNDIPKDGATRGEDKQDEQVRPRARRRSPTTNSAGGTVSPPAGIASRSRGSLKKGIGTEVDRTPHAILRWRPIAERSARRPHREVEAMSVDAALSGDGMSFIGEMLPDPPEWPPLASARSPWQELRLDPGRRNQA
jgi:hypothetical protein